MHFPLMVIKLIYISRSNSKKHVSKTMVGTVLLEVFLCLFTLYEIISYRPSMVVDLSLNELAETNDMYCQRNRQLIQEYEKR